MCVFRVDAIKSQGRGCCIIRIGVIEGVAGGVRRRHAQPGEEQKPGVRAAKDFGSEGQKGKH